MSDEKPLHVRVAEALGWWRVASEYDRSFNVRPHACGCWNGVMPGEDGHGWSIHIPHYDTNWSATGPLIEKYSILLDRDVIEAEDSTNGQFVEGDWWARAEGREYNDSAALLAVCGLILALSEAGKLPK